MLGTKVKVIGEASSFRSTEDYDYVLYYSKIKTADGKTYFIDSNKLTDEKPDMRPRFTYTKQKPETMYFYNTAPVYSLNLKDGTSKEKKKIKVRTAVTVLGKAIPREDTDYQDYYYKIKTSSGETYYAKTETLNSVKPAPFNTNYKSNKGYKKMSEKYQKKVDKIMRNFVISYDEMGYVWNMIGSDTIIEWMDYGYSWEHIAETAECVTTPHEMGS